MRTSEKSRFLPIVVFLAVPPALLLPLLQRLHLPDAILGLTMGFPIGLAIVALARMIRRGDGCAS